MESLLRWGIENSTSDGSSTAQGRSEGSEPRRDLDPAILDAILGKPDSELMKEALAIIVDERNSEDDRLSALDNFEMLVEQIDNANNITAMNMWTPLHRLLQSPSSPDEIKANTLWVIGTAVQNNPAAQSGYLALPNSPISIILSLLSSSSVSAQTRSKAVYALSGLLKHNAKTVAELEEAGGWDVLKGALEDPDITVRRKTAFLLNTLLLPSNPNEQTEASTTNQGPVHHNSHASMTAESSDTSGVTIQALRRHGIIEAVAQALVNPLPHGNDGENDGDVDFTEKLIRLLHTYLVDCSCEMNDSEKHTVRLWLQKQRDQGAHWDLGQEELSALSLALS